MTTYNTPDLIAQLRAEFIVHIEELKERIVALENTKKPTVMSEQHAIEMEAIMQVFDSVPVGFELSIPAIAKNLEIDLPRDAVTTRVYTLVKAGKLKRHQEGNEHPTFSRLP